MFSTYQIRREAQIFLPEFLRSPAEQGEQKSLETLETKNPPTAAQESLELLVEKNQPVSQI